MLALVLLALLGGGLWFFQTEKNSARLRAEQQLAALAHLKVEQLMAWRKERQDDAAALTDNPAFLRRVALFFEQADKAQADALRRELSSLRDHGRYANLLLVDTKGQVRLSVSGQRQSFTGHESALAEALHSYGPVFTELHSDAQCPQPHIELIAPVIGPELRTARPLGAVVLVSDATGFLQPLLMDWKRPSPTTEVLLVRREGDGALLLNALLDRSAAVQHRHTPLSRTDSLAAMAVSGKGGFVEGEDDRGTASLAFIASVPGSNWHLIAKDEASAIFGVWRFRAALLMVVFAVLAGGAGCLGLFLWQYKQKTAYQALYAAEARLRRSLEHQSITLKAIGESIVAVDAQGRVELLNPVAEKLTGWRQDEAVGRLLGEVVCLVDEASREQIVLPVTDGIGEGLRRDDGGQPLLIAQNGTEHAVGMAVSPLRNECGDAVGTVLVFQDRTDERREQRLIQARLALREHAFVHGPEEICLRGLREIAALMDSPLALWGGNESGKNVLAFRSQVAAEGCEASVDRVSETCRVEALCVDQPVICNDLGASSAHTPQTRPCFGTIREAWAPVLQGGKVVAVAGVADKPEPYTEQDIAIVSRLADDIWRLVEQKKVEEALLFSERRYRTLYRSMMDAFVLTDMTGNIRECNEPYAAMLGYTCMELRRLNVRDLTPEQWLIYENDHVKQQLLHDGCTNLYEKEYRRKDGTVFPVELRTFLVTGNDGLPEGMSAVVRDISARKRAEEEGEKLRERLNQAQKMESIGLLAGGVAHDFNNMLSVIQGYAELALRKIEPTDPLHKNIQEIVRAGRRSAEITRQLLAFARKQTIAPQMLDLNATMTGMLTMLKRLIGEDIELKWLPGANIWPIMMDPAQVDQLLANLCVNARDAVDGAGTITIETGMVSFDAAYCAERNGFLPGDYAMLAVSDNGCGIERDLLDKIFEPFFTTKDMGEGTGLGLATVYGIVKQNNGFVNVYSEPGEGTTFRVYLPRMEGPVAEFREELVAEVQLGQGETVLVVEDEEAILALNKTMLEHLGYSVLTANSPLQALRLAAPQAGGIDLLLTDVIMPEMNGRDLAKELTILNPRLKVLFVSGYTENVIVHRGVLDRSVFFLPKPFSLEELAAKVKETLGA